MRNPPALPWPPPDLRRAVGPLEDRFYDNPSGAPIFPGVPPELYDTVFDFGCGCGRLARQLIQQRPQPRRYVGVDLNRAAVDWCDAHLRPAAPHFTFRHLDIFNLGFNPAGSPAPIALPMDAGAATLVIAWSVFTHVLEADAVFYLKEAARLLRAEGRLISTWFLFDKRDFPMLQDFQNALFVNHVDPTNAVIFDAAWVRAIAADAGLDIVEVTAPRIRGFQWELVMSPRRPGRGHAAFPADAAPFGRQPPPLLPHPPAGPLPGKNRG